jgi:hypothetical protein
MSSTLYNEAIEAAEQIKLSAEEKVKQQIIESISPQIKIMVEKKLFESDEELTSQDDCSYESIKEESQDEVKEEQTEQEDSKPVELNQESRRILNKLISQNSRIQAAKQKISDLKESINSLQKAIILSESSDKYSVNKPRIIVLYKNLVNEIAKLNKNGIIRNNKELLEEFYKLNKELENMSSRHSNKKYLNESFDDLLEIDLFEADEVKEDDDADLLAADEDPKPENEEESEVEAEEVEEAEESGDEVTDLTTVRELAIMAGLVEEDEDVGQQELNLEGLFEDDHEQKEAYEGTHLDEDEDEVKDGPEEIAESFDRVLEIDENMLRREIGRMKSLREGEAKDIASQFGGGSEEGEAFVDGVDKLQEMKTKAAKVVRTNRMLESKLSQYKEALQGMKTHLSEMNLFNAKLLYANKLMQNRDLSMKQQRNIVESLDEAKTIGEAKILFESLSKSLVSSKASRNSNLSEGALRRSSSSSSNSVRSGQAKPINESVALDRWATLAGIRK